MTLLELQDALDACTVAGDGGVTVQVTERLPFASYQRDILDVHIAHVEVKTDRGLERRRIVEIRI